MKKIIFTLLLFLTCYTSFAWNNIIDVKKDNYRLRFLLYSEQGKDFAVCCNFTTYGSNPHYVKSVNIPENVSDGQYDYTVTEITDSVFSSIYNFGNLYMGWVQSITLPNTIEKIGKGAFEGCNFHNIDLPHSLKYIGDGAFRATELEFITIPKTVEYIGNNAFSQNLDTAIVNNAGTFGESTPITCKTLIYTNSKAPKNWIASHTTYVPDLLEYSSPYSKTSTSHIIEMITWKQNRFIYTGTINIPEYTNNINGYSVDLDFSSLHKDAGIWSDTIMAHFKDNNNGHDFTTRIPFNYTILPKALTIKAENTSRIYGDENSIFSISYDGFVNKENESVLRTLPSATTTATRSSDVGEYPINVSGGNANNYTLSYIPGVLTIKKAPLSAKINDVSREYGIDNPSFTITYNGLKNGEIAPKWKEDVKIETSATRLSNVGEYILSATGTPVNYNLQEIVNGKLTIIPASLILKANDATKLYFEENPEFTYTCIGLRNNEDKDILQKEPTIIASASKNSNVGIYDITPSNAAAQNYTITYEKGKFSIDKRPLKVTSNSTR